MVSLLVGYWKALKYALVFFNSNPTAENPIPTRGNIHSFPACLEYRLYIATAAAAFSFLLVGYRREGELEVGFRKKMSSDVFCGIQ